MRQFICICGYIYKIILNKLFALYNHRFFIFYFFKRVIIAQRIRCAIDSHMMCKTLLQKYTSSMLVIVIILRRVLDIDDINRSNISRPFLATCYKNKKNTSIFISNKYLYA